MRAFIRQFRESQERVRTQHPAKQLLSRAFWHDRSDQSKMLQVIDLLHDIRTLLLLLAVLMFFD